MNEVREHILASLRERVREKSKEYEKAVGRKQQEHGSGKEPEGRRDRERAREGKVRAERQVVRR